MAYRVDISLPALSDAENAYLRIKEESPEKAVDWYKGLLDWKFWARAKMKKKLLLKV